MKEKVRESNFELLRIIAMLMVVTLHYMGHGGALNGTNRFSVNFIFANILEAFSIYAVNIYVLISAYFLCDSKFSMKKIIKIWIQVVSYSFMIYLVLSITGFIKFNMFNLMKALLPIIFNQYSFVTAYIILLLLSPFLNKLIISLTKKEYIKLNIILITFFSLFSVGFPIGIVLNSYLSTFIVLYFLASYIKMHLNLKIKKIYYLATYILCSILIFSGRMLIYFMGKDGKEGLLLSYNFILVIIGAVTLFIWFKNLKIQSKFINSISVLTFGVFLIHDNNYIRSFLYKDILKTNIWYNDSLFIVISVLSIFAIFITCCLIEKIRLSIENKINVSDKLYSIARRRLYGRN